MSERDGCFVGAGSAEVRGAAMRADRLKKEIGEEPITGIEDRLSYRFVKRAFDIVFSAAVLVFFCWLFAVIAILIKIDDPKGPVLFKQERVGKNGKTFNMYKFRSMCVDAEGRLAELRELNERTGPVFKIAEDPRVTRVGKWLRKLSLDELPQFMNVLVGDIPSRILKTRQVFSEKKPGAFALPATEVRTSIAVFPQVKGLSKASLRTLRFVSSHSIATFNISSHFLAKRISEFKSWTKVAA